MTKFMGIDIGTSSVKVVVIDYKGNIVAQSSVNYSLLMPSKRFCRIESRNLVECDKRSYRKSVIFSEN